MLFDLGNNEMVEFLLNNGADPNVRNEDGTTPLHIAAECGDPYVYIDRVKIADMLMKHGADPNAGDSHKQTPLMIAADNGRFKSKISKFMHIFKFGHLKS